MMQPHMSEEQRSARALAVLVGHEITEINRERQRSGRSADEIAAERVTLLRQATDATATAVVGGYEVGVARSEVAEVLESLPIRGTAVRDSQSSGLS